MAYAYRPTKAAEPSLGTREDSRKAMGGPWRFMMSTGKRRVAYGVEFGDGTVVVRWLGTSGSTNVHMSRDDMVSVHIDGHDDRSIEWHDTPPSEASLRGATNEFQDSCENCPFASIGGLEHRSSPLVPGYIDPADDAEFLRGYLTSAHAEYGDDWRTCSFGWHHVLTIGDAP